MKFKLTPLIIVSVGTILFGMFYIISGMGGNLGPPAGMMIILTGVICLVPYFLFRRIFKTSIARQVITETVLIIIVLFFFYKRDETLVLEVPQNFKGYIAIVYGVANKPTLKVRSFFSNANHITVPNTGIIFTSDKFDYGSLVVIDSSNNTVKKLYPGRGIALHRDSLRCGNNIYFIDVLGYGEFAPHFPKKDREARLLNVRMKKELACNLLLQKM